MGDKSSDSSSRENTLYQEFLAEREEVMRQKWLKSEKEGGDVGLERVLVEWASEERAEWKREYLKKFRAQST